MNWQQLKSVWQQQWSLKVAVIYLCILLCVVLLAPVFPGSWGVNALDLQNAYLPPAFFTEADLHAGHWLGTDQLGRDVWVNLLFGARTAFLVALPVLLLALLLGTTLGFVVAWYGNKGWSITWAALCSFLLWLLGVFFFVVYRQPTTYDAVLWFGIASGGAWALFRLMKTLSFLAQKVRVPLDELLLKLMEVLSAVPRLVLVLSFAVLLEPGFGNVILLLSLTYWIGFARLARAEALKIKALPYIEAAQSAGLPVWRIWFRHVLPNVAGPLITACCFGLSSLLGLEATLSFLGIGLPPETPSWGRMLSGARLNPEAWWLVLFPASVLCLTILAVQAVGQAFRKIFNFAV